MPPIHGRRAQLPVSPRPPVSWAPENTAGDEAYPHAPLAPQPPLHGRRGVVRSGMRRSHRDIAGTLGRPMFTLRTEVNLHNPLIPRPYKQNTVQPSAMPLSDTIVLAVRPNSPLRLPTASERAFAPARAAHGAAVCAVRTWRSGYLALRRPSACRRLCSRGTPCGTLRASARDKCAALPHACSRAPPSRPWPRARVAGPSVSAALTRVRVASSQRTRIAAIHSEMDAFDRKMADLAELAAAQAPPRAAGDDADGADAPADGELPGGAQTERASGLPGGLDLPVPPATDRPAVGS